LGDSERRWPVAVTAKYTEQVVFMVTKEVRKRLDDESEAKGVSMAEVARDYLDKGMEEETSEATA